MLDSLQFKEEQRQKVVVLQPQLPTRPQVQIKLPTEPDKGVAEMLHKKRQRKSESNNNNEGEGTTAFSTPMSRPPSLQILLQVFKLGIMDGKSAMQSWFSLQKPTNASNEIVSNVTVFHALISVGGFTNPNINDNCGSRPVYDVKDPTGSDSGSCCSKADCRPHNDLCHIVINLDAATPVAGSIHFESAIDIVRYTQQGFTSMKCS